MSKLKLSADRKVSPLSRWEFVKKTLKWRAKPKVMNSFGLPALISCPGFTEWCKTICYAFSTQRFYPSVQKLVDHNLEVLRSAGSNIKKMTELLCEMVASVNWHGTTPVFRWHWDGDIFSAPYAVAIANTCEAFPNIQFWLYTRSFDFVHLLRDIPNLAVYLSVDEYNMHAAIDIRDSYPQFLVAACADTWDESEVLMRKVVGRNAPRCPELTGKIPLVSPDGIGACVACGLCIYGRNHVRFASKH